MNWEVIIENFIAESGAAILFGIFLTWLLTWRKRQKPKIIINMEDSPRQGFHWISIAIANQGRTAFQVNELDWHLYWPHVLEGEFIDFSGHALGKGHNQFVVLGESNIEGTRHSHLSNFNNVPLFPDREIEILKFRLNREYKSFEVEVRYEFSTIFGQKPKWVWQIWRWKKIKDKNGFPQLSLLPLAEIRDIRNSNYRDESFVPPEKLSKKFLIP